MINIQEEHLVRLGVPKVHWGAKLGLIPDKCKHVSLVRKYLTGIEANVEKPTGMLLFGPYSSGKSGIGSMCLKSAAVHGIIGFWTAAFDITKWQIEKTLFEPGLTVYERCLEVPLLVIDEYQMRKDMKFMEDTVDALIRARVDSKVCTIITTNHTPDRIKDARPAMFAALQEAVVPVKVEGHDFRAGKAQLS